MNCRNAYAAFTEFGNSARAVGNAFSFLKAALEEAYGTAAAGPSPVSSKYTVANDDGSPEAAGLKALADELNKP